MRVANILFDNRSCNFFVISLTFSITFKFWGNWFQIRASMFKGFGTKFVLRQGATKRSFYLVFRVT